MSSSAPNGSSSSMTVGCTTRHRAIATRWRMPPDSCAGLAFSKPVSPTSSISPSTRPGAGVIPATSNGSRMLPVTLRHGSSAASWKAMPSWWSRWISRVERPLISAVPDVGSSSPARIRRIVDLPQPDGPSSDRNEFSAVPRSTAASASTERRPIVNRFVRPRMSIPVAAAARPAARLVALACDAVVSRHRSARAVFRVGFSA